VPITSIKPAKKNTNTKQKTVKIHRDETLNTQNQNNMAAVVKKQHKRNTGTKTLNPDNLG
jgi:hypothetical protein